MRRIAAQYLPQSLPVVPTPIFPPRLVKKNPPPKIVKQKTEYQECLSFWHWVKTVPILSKYMIKIVNEGKRTAREAMCLKAIGLRPGLPDYFLPLVDSRRKYHGLWIEFKRPGLKRNLPSEQRTWHDNLAHVQHEVTLVYSADEAMEVVQYYVGESRMLELSA